MTYPCPDGCGRKIANWTQACFPMASWDSPNLPPRAWRERCPNHRNLCAYRSDDPARCPKCHTARACECGVAR